ncbi:hypothetical protein H0486_04385 [Lachnospiraceae bacterium MD1]|jgi:uncharacterized membrane protein|uniref:TM2 domain-containing protein n=1 Tax=Variimorphobacter saccharofermentans TaxID=2755051 RepID=A0A839K057_9FIRM|nr:hypothetical protein [Variimorphobacter saccharofermentans]MBB2182111.1 hypothetical protein [Variimorphobacter saccharofermentans]
MIRKKSGFLTFCFSLLPGAGQMYMGFMKRGLSLMSIFFFLIFLGVWLNVGSLMLAMPIIWFFSFFDTHNLRSMPDDEFYAMEDNYILLPDTAKEHMMQLQSKYRVVLAIALIVVGISILWNNMYEMIRWFIPDVLRNALYRFGHYFPQLFIGFLIILLGIYLIRGKKKDLDTKEQIRMLEDKGGNEQ